MTRLQKIAWLNILAGLVTVIAVVSSFSLKSPHDALRGFVYLAIMAVGPYFSVKGELTNAIGPFFAGRRCWEARSPMLLSFWHAPGYRRSCVLMVSNRYPLKSCRPSHVSGGWS